MLDVLNITPKTVGMSGVIEESKTTGFKFPVILTKAENALNTLGSLDKTTGLSGTIVETTVEKPDRAISNLENAQLILDGLDKIEDLESIRENRCL